MHHILSHNRFVLLFHISDGLCCQYGSGSYTVKYGGVEVASGGAFGSTTSHTFGSSEPSPTPPPTKFPTKSPVTPTRKLISFPESILFLHHFAHHFIVSQTNTAPPTDNPTSSPTTASPTTSESPSKAPTCKFDLYYSSPRILFHANLLRYFVDSDHKIRLL